MAKTARMKLDRTASQAAKPPSPLTTLMRTAVRTQADPVELAAFGSVDAGWAAASRRGAGRAPSTALEAAQTRMTARVEEPELEQPAEEPRLKLAPEPEPDRGLIERTKAFLSKVL